MQITWSPTVSDELSLRIGPLRQAWEAYGPGLLKEVTATFGEEFLVNEATIVPVAPVHGGGGEIDAARRVVKIEAVLTNPHPQLPEVLRLAWLLSQLGIEDGSYCQSDGERIAWPIGLMAIVLAAAQRLDLARHDEATIRLAMRAWRLLKQWDQAGP